MAKKAAAKAAKTTGAVKVPNRPQVTISGLTAEDYLRYKEHADRERRGLADWCRLMIDRGIAAGLSKDALQ